MPRCVNSGALSLSNMLRRVKQHYFTHPTMSNWQIRGLCPHSFIALLPALESMESKRHTSYRSYSTNVYKQSHSSTARKLLLKTARTQIVLSLETPWTLYNYINLEDDTAHGAKYCWHNGAQNKNQKTPKTWNTVRYSVSNNHKPSTIPSRKWNNCIWASFDMKDWHETRCKNA